jgi:four helix bundle protein
MGKTDLEGRTKVFALGVIGYVAKLPRTQIENVLGNQLLRSGTSIGANYREANRAESRNDFIHKIGIAEKEAAETQYWLELCKDARLGDLDACERLLQEVNELIAILVSIGKTSKARSQPLRNPNSEFRISHE